MTTRNHPGYTIQVPVTAREPVPQTIVVKAHPDGSATATASRKLDRRRMSATLHRHFGNRAGWPFAKGRAWSFRAKRRAVIVADRGDVAWFDEDLETGNLGPARGSGVMVRDEETGRWLIAHYNLAITIPNELFGEVRRVLEGR